MYQNLLRPNLLVDQAQDVNTRRDVDGFAEAASAYMEVLYLAAITNFREQTALFPMSNGAMKHGCKGKKNWQLYSISPFVF